MDAAAESSALHERARALVDAFDRGAPAPESFDSLALALGRFQASRVPGYARLCAARGLVPAAARRAGDFPAVPAEAFKVGSVFAFDRREAAVTFRTSGTTAGARGEHSFRDIATYDAAALAFGRRMIAQDVPAPLEVIVVGPSAAEAGDSSLTHMYALFARRLGVVRSDADTYFVRGGGLDVGGLRARIARVPRDAPVLVLATSLALVHLLDGLGSAPLALPSRSRVVQTGGFKSSTRQVVPDDLRRAAAAAFAVDESAVVSEYGMTELSSQFWEATLAAPRAGRGVYLEPPWARVVPVDPETLEPVPAGAVGIARIEDLANVDSAFAVLTQDRARRVDGGFELLGRVQGAPPRGCSLATEEMLGPLRSP